MKKKYNQRYGNKLYRKKSTTNKLINTFKQFQMFTYILWHAIQEDIGIEKRKRHRTFQMNSQIFDWVFYLCLFQYTNIQFVYRFESIHIFAANKTENENENDKDN